MTITPTPHVSPASGRWPAWLGLAFALGLAAGLLLPSGQVARACSCLPPPPPPQALEQAVQVFDGSVVGIEQVDPDSPFGAQRVDFVVHTQWKGVTEGRIRLETAGDSAMCGYSFQLGRRYLVYATGALEAPTVTNCSRTQPWSATEAEALGPDEPPAGATPWPVWSSQPPPPNCPRCAAPPAPAEAMAAAAAVFHGQLIGIQDLGPEDAHAHRLVFRNRGWWKGASEARVEVRLPWALWSCEGERWARLEQPDAPEGFIVYAAADAEGRLELRLCGRTRVWDAEEAAALGSPSAPEQPTETPVPSATHTGPPRATATPDPCAVVPPCPPCAGPRPARDWLDESDAVFHGRVIAVESLGPGADCERRVRFAVDETWKGPSAAEMTIDVGNDAWHCSRSYPLGDETVVFARADADGRLRVPLCFGIVDGDVRAELGPGRAPASDRSPLAHRGGRIRAIVPLPGSDLAWLAQGPRVMAVSLAPGEDILRFGPGLLLPDPVTQLAVDGDRGLALTGPVLQVLDLSQPDRPRRRSSIQLGDLGERFGPLALAGSLAFVGHAGAGRPDDVAVFDIDTGDRLTATLLEGARPELTDLIAAGDLLAVASRDRTPDAAFPSRLQLYDLATIAAGPPIELALRDAVDDVAVGRLAYAEVAGQPRLYSLGPGGIVGWSLQPSTALPEALVRWPAEWRPDGFDPVLGDLAVGSGGEVFVSLHRWVGGFATAGEVLRVLPSPDSVSGRWTERVHQSLRPLDARLVAADDARGGARLLMAGPEGLSSYRPGSASPSTYPMVTDAIGLALHLDDPGPVLYALSAKAGINGFLLNQPDPSAPQPYTFFAAGAERGGLTVDAGRLVMDNLGITDIRDQKLEIVTVGGALLPTRQSEIDLRDAGAGLVWAQSGPYLILRRGPDTVALYDLTDPSAPVERDRLQLAGLITDLVLHDRQILVAHYDQRLPGSNPDAASIRLTTLAIEGEAGDPNLAPRGEALVEAHAVYVAGLPQLAFDPLRSVAWLTGAVGCAAQAHPLLYGMDVSSPSAPSRIPWGWEDLREAPSDLVYADGQVFLPGRRTWIMDVRNPRIPTWAGELDVADAVALSVHDQTVFAAAGAAGIYIFQPDLAWDSDPAAPTPVPEITPSSLPPTPTPDCRPSPTPSPTRQGDPGTATPTAGPGPATATPFAPTRPPAGGRLYLPLLRRD
ncbi:MAG: hypothetical protein H6648_02285 [Caldilineae bacterium]|nr:hypothetical protein [Chloroflexota bacterium]MCB9175960.1 hypothetical protein [Caldilineae bacterium]